MNNQESPKEYRPTFPMSADDARIAAREEEYQDYLFLLGLASDSPDYGEPKEIVKVSFLNQILGD